MSINFGCFSLDIAGSISRLWNCIKPHKDYVCKLEENLDALRSAKGGLTALKNDVKERVKTEEVQLQRKMLDTVRDWVARVEDMEAQVDEEIKVGSEEIEKKCLGGCCYKNCRSTYKIGKKVAKKIEEVTSLKSEGNFPGVTSEQVLAAGSAVERAIIEPVGLESAFNDAKRYIEDERVGTIGIYGMGGVGKTTLLIKINNSLRSNFELVIWVVVSKNSTILKVQNGIGEKMGIHDDTWKNKSQDEKATRIFGVLKSKRFLLLLDDIWERIDLIQVGVPPRDEHNKSKVVFTTRSEDVCGRMKAQKQIKVKCLGPEKAWDLFKENIGEATLNSHPEILGKAKIVVNECKGVPLALITIGQAMARRKTPEEWDHARRVLKENAAKFLDMEDEVFPILKFSYDSLQSDKYRSCFLYCSLFPEDYLIPKERLIEYWIGEGFLNGFNDINEGYVIIGTLVRACLLEDSGVCVRNHVDYVPDMSGSVKMHDVIRDMALWIACECSNEEDKFLVQAGNSLIEAPGIEKWKGVKRMSLMRNKIEELSEIPSCPNLLALFLNMNHLTMITSGFFQNMLNLRVLDLSQNPLVEGLPVELSELVSIQYLNLSRTTISVLPIEYKNLVQLKYLNLEHTERLYTIPQGLLSSFKKLRVLKMYRCGCTYLPFVTFLEEVESLKELNHLSFSVRTALALPQVLRSPKVRSCTKLLGIIRWDDVINPDLSFLQSMGCLHRLVFISCDGLVEFKVERANLEIMESHQLFFHSLRCVNLLHCQELKDATWLIFAPNLESLTVQTCYEMEEVICGGKWGEASTAEEAGYLNLFAKLKELFLLHLPQLKNICPNALPFSCLKSLKVVCCPNLKKLPLNSDSAEGCVIEGSRDWLDEIEWKDEATQNAFLPFSNPGINLNDTDYDTAGVM